MELGNQKAIVLLTNELTLDKSWSCGTSVSLARKLDKKAKLYQNQMWYGALFFF